MISGPRLGLLCTIATATLLIFAMTGTAAAVGMIKGKVVDFTDKAGADEVRVCALEPAQLKFAGCTFADEDGEYTLSGLADGGYLVEFWAPFLGYATQFYDGVASFEDADEVTVSGATVSGIDAEMKEGGKIEGRVTDAGTGAGINQIEVCAFAFGIGGRCGFTDTFGNYALISLATGSYFVEFFDELGEYEGLFYNQQASFENASPVGVVAPDATAGIDARLSKPGTSIVTPSVSSAPSFGPLPTVIKKPRRKAVKCRKGFKKVKRHGRKVCVKKHKRKKSHRS